MFKQYTKPLVLAVMNQCSSIKLAVAARDLGWVPSIHPYVLDYGPALAIDWTIIDSALSELQRFNLAVYRRDLAEALPRLSPDRVSLEILDSGLPPDQPIPSTEGWHVVNRFSGGREPVKGAVCLVKGCEGAGLVPRESVWSLARAVNFQDHPEVWLSGGMGQQGWAQRAVQMGARAYIGTLAALSTASPLSDAAARRLMDQTVVEQRRDRESRAVVWGGDSLQRIRSATDRDWNHTRWLAASTGPDQGFGMLYAGMTSGLPQEWSRSRPSLEAVDQWLLQSSSEDQHELP